MTLSNSHVIVCIETIDFKEEYPAFTGEFAHPLSLEKASNRVLSTQ